MKKLKLKNILESLNPKTSLEEKKSFLQEVERFNEYGSVIYRTEDLRKVAESINSLCEKAETITLEEAQDWFDEVTIRREVKQLNTKRKNFVETIHEMSKMQQRLEALYEDIGHTLSRYFEIKGMDDNIVDENLTPDQVRDLKLKAADAELKFAKQKYDAAKQGQP
jgi:hypothetical protein